MPQPPYDVLTIDDIHNEGGEYSAAVYAPGPSTGVGLHSTPDFFAFTGYRPCGPTTCYSSVRLGPPTGQERFAVGTYQARTYPDAEHALFDNGTCNGYEGEIVVHEVTYGDDGTLATFAASYDVSCGSGRFLQHRMGEVRWKSALPYAGVEFTGADTGQVVIDQRIERTAGYRNAGVLPVTVSGVTLGGAAPGDWAITSNDCVRVLAPGDSCTLGVAVTPTADGDAGTRDAVLVVADSTPRGRHEIPLTVDVRAAGTPTGLTVVPMINRNVLSWTAGPGRPARGWGIRRGPIF